MARETSDSSGTNVDVAVVGAGLVGCLLAVYLARRGLTVGLFERRPDPRAAGSERGRSINLAISARGIDALDRVGLTDRVMAEALPMSGRLIHDEAGATQFVPYSADGQRAINSISRSALNDTLLAAALDHAEVSAHFDHRLSSLRATEGRLDFDTPTGPRTVEAGVVIGADGAYSAVRSALMSMPGFDYRQDFLDCQYKELTIPARDGEFALDPAALHIWPRGGSMMIALPNPDRTFTCTLFWPPTGADSFAGVPDGASAVEYFRRRYPDALPLMPGLASEYDANPIGSLVTVRCARWSAHGRVALIGDAAHAITPFFGQGANAGFEDVVELDRCLGEADGDWTRALPEYERRRIDNANAIADMALENFVEMSTKSASRVFQAQHAVRHALHRALPQHYSTRYELVSFSTTPYAEVLRRTSGAGAARSVLSGVGGAALDLVNRRKDS